MTKGVNAVFLRCNSRKELWDWYKRINHFMNDDIHYKKYADVKEYEIHYVGISIGKKVLLNNEYQFLTGVFTNHRNNAYKSYLFFTFEDYKKIMNKYKFKLFLSKEKKEFLKEFNKKVKC